MGCPAPAYKTYQFCTTCHKDAVKDGGVMCKDGNWKALDSSVQKVAAMARAADDFFYYDDQANESLHNEAYQAEAERGLQQQADGSISEEQVTQSIHALQAYLKARPEVQKKDREYHADNAHVHDHVRDDNRFAALSEPCREQGDSKRQRSGDTAVDSLLAAIGNRRQQHDQQ
jgi:hypothetical protein